MRIGYYIPAWPPGAFPNGIVTTLGHLGRQLRSSGHDVFYVTPTRQGEEDPWVRLIPYHKPSLLKRLMYRVDFEERFFSDYADSIASAFADLAKNERLDIIQMEETHGWAQRVISRVEKPVVVRLHGPWFANMDLGKTTEEKPENRNRISREERAIFAAAGVAAPSKDILNRTIDFYGRKPAIAEVIPNPIEREPSESRWSLENCNRNQILFVGRFDKIKGADILLKAFSQVIEHHEDLQLIFVGPDVGLVSESGAAYGIENYCKSELPERTWPQVKYMGPLNAQEIKRLRRQSYLTIIASRYETFGNVAIEAMASGCPIIAPEVGGLREILHHERNSLAYAPEDVTGLRNALKRLIDEPGLAVQLASNAYEDCQTNFSPEAIARKTVRFYADVIAAYRAQPRAIS